MRVTLRNLKSFKDEICAHSNVKIFCPSKKKWVQVEKPRKKTQYEEIPKQDTKSESTEYRENEMNIQMLSRSLFQQIFKDDPKKIDNQIVERYHKNLKSFGLVPGTSSDQPDVNIELPSLKGSNIEEHFYEIGREQCHEYRELIDSILNSNLPKLPDYWEMKPGWTKYDSNGNSTSVPYPEERALVFDVEVCMVEGHAPTIACAVGSKNWYSWTSSSLLTPTNRTSSHASSDIPRYYNSNEFIPLEAESDSKSKNAAKIVIGHNVSYDRGRVKNQYQLASTGMRFLDTMSLHVCVSGITSYQRAMLNSSKEVDDHDLLWRSQSSLNNLLEVFKLYCGESSPDMISKEARSVFVSGNLDDVRNNFQDLMKYCAKDVIATFRVMEKLFPMFCERFPHPVTLAGMLEVGMAYLPVNSNWIRYINESNLIYKDLHIESNYLLAKRANQACRLLHDEAYKKDLWMWDQDWSTREVKMKKAKPLKKSKNNPVATLDPCIAKEPVGEYEYLWKKFKYLFEMKEHLPVKIPMLSGHPAWYRKLCKSSTEPEWQPGPSEIGTGMQVCPKLLNLTWEGYPVHFIKGQGWGFLVPFKTDTSDNANSLIPLKELVAKCPAIESPRSANSTESNDAFVNLNTDVEKSLSKKDYYSRPIKDPTNGLYTGTGVWCNTELDNSCWFFKLPHKDGPSKRVGNPLARDFLVKFSENVLAGDSSTAERVIQIARMLSYWRNTRERIINQLVVVCDEKRLPSAGRKGGVAAILPQVVPCGTLTRRAMEPTWMTASNVQEERVGSELRAMVQAPKGYRLIGADVDSQELWIASVLGDASATGIHGATPLGWMTLNGTKASATDMHSVTAKAVGISRNHAKVLNYARIYGAGQLFATRLIKQFNPSMTDGEAKSKAMKMFAMTKGKKLYFLKDEFKDHLDDKGYSSYEAMKLTSVFRKPITEIFHKAKWYNGTESAMFNRLEEIAEMDHPQTPFLNSRLSRALEPNHEHDDRFLPTRINWVVQSGAVDFLHLMLVCMRWLMSTKVRFCLSFHDEIRYLAKEEYAYQAALAMHITNLLTRSFCASRLGLKDLPQSIAFFASVEVDRVLRKDAHLDCKTPSNPHGLEAGYGIPPGESLDVLEAIVKAKGNDLNKWPWHKKHKNE